MAYIVHRLNRTDVIPTSEITGGRVHQTSQESLGIKEKQERELAYFGSLDMQARMDLYELYRPDFELFGYDPVPYIEAEASTRINAF